MLATERGLAVVVHPGNEARELSFTELRRIYLGERLFWPGDVRVTLLVPPPGSREREILLANVYHGSEAEYRHHWIAMVFRTEATSAPKVVPSSEMALELVRAIPGAIAVMDSSRVGKGVRLLPIDGKRPGQASYPLR
jgi:hypothetical protein